MVDAHRLEVIERLAKVETRVESIDARLAPMAESIEKVADHQEQQRGFISGAFWAVSAIWALAASGVALAWEFFRTH